ncbi:hypothetical protein LRS13_06050 [Svornostia abyssi]|uniref:Nucleotidyltransferase family protein n=1 Tax=Svornostia abyssi TaxID=2898438 RepID=A0ABY5PK63_9ACTN|nr:hypothetical protein LRS13_06050 [Parviterribacteraceae bacterium J379]
MTALDPGPLLRALHQGGVEYIIVGGFAVIAHGYVRQSQDLDIVPEPSPENLRRLAATLRSLHARQLDTDDFTAAELPANPLDPEDLARGGNFRLTTDLGFLDVLQWVSGIDADDLYAVLAPDALAGDFEGIPVRACGLSHLRAMKRAAGRPRDLDDLEHLGFLDGD